MCDKKPQFSNPDCLPVESLSITVHDGGVVRQLPALDPHWAEKRDTMLYEPPPSGSDLVPGALDAWKTRMEPYLEDIKWLLNLEYYRFWSTIVYQSSCTDSLVSFLQEADPPYISSTIRDLEAHTVYMDIRKCVLLVFCRLSTNKESKTEWMTKEHMAELLYNKFIFTVPVLWDICLVYAADNRQLVCRLVTSVFTLQPNYENDAEVALRFVNESLKYIIQQVNEDYEAEVPPNLPETFRGFGEIRRPPSASKPVQGITFPMLRDLALHLVDTAMTLRVFLEVYPRSVDAFRKTNVVNSIVQLYEYGIPPLYKRLEDLCDPSSPEFSEVVEYLELARSDLIDIFREMLAVYKNAIFSGEGNKASHVECYLTVMMDGLAERLLIKEYNACYPVHEDIDMLRQAYPQIDSVKTDYILQAIYSNMDEPVPEHLLSANQEPYINGHLEPDPIDLETDATVTIDNTIPDKVKEESMISEVKDILPHLGEGFILKCLQHYGFNSERVVSSILEDNLDPSLKGLDQSLPIIPEDPLDKDFLETGVARLNVFDGDEFDVRTRDDVDVTRIHRGKRKSKYKNLAQMLDDKTEVKRLAEVYAKYGLVCEDDPEYNDEYDDAYDSNDVPPPAEPTADEARRPFVTPRALRPKESREQVESEEESEDEEEQAGVSNKSRLDFCANPEEVRARREAAYQARRGRGIRPPPAQAKITDVKGKPKGQGQEKDVLHNRDKKEKHKSSRANHSRRQGAQWKRSQGMMPS